MRRALTLLLLLGLLVGSLFLIARGPDDDGGNARPSAADARTPPEAITLRGRAPSPADAVGSEAAPPGSDDGSLPAEAAPKEAPVRLTIHIALEGFPAGTPLDPPASIRVYGVTDPIDSFFSMGVSRDVSATGRVDLDVRSVLGEVGRLGRAPEMAIWLHQPAGRAQGRSVLLTDVEGLLAGRRTLDDVTFTLRPATRVTGTVRNAAGVALSRGSVRAYRLVDDVPLPETVHAVGVEKQGRFEMAVEGEGTFLLVAYLATWNAEQRRRGHGLLPQGRVVVLEQGEEPPPIEFQLSEGAWIQGEVIHPAHGRAGGAGRVAWHLAEECVSLQGRPDELAWIDGEVVWARGEIPVADGRFRVQGVPSRACDFLVTRLEDVVLAEPLGRTRRGPEETRVTLAPACAALEIDARMQGDLPVPSAFSIRVLPWELEAGDAWPRKVSSGSRILVSPSSRFRVEAYDARFGSLSTEVTSGSAGTTTPVVLLLRSMTRSTLVVHLHLPDGSPYSSWAAFALAEPQSPIEVPRLVWSSALHGKDGVYRLEGVPEGRWRLHVRTGRSTFWGRPSGYLERTVDVVAPPQNEPAATVPVEAGARLVVRVADADGVPQAGTVSIHERGGRVVPAVFVSDFDFDFGGAVVRGAPGQLPWARTLWLATALEPGTYDVHIEPDGGRPSVHTIHVDANETQAISITTD